MRRPAFSVERGAWRKERHPKVSLYALRYPLYAILPFVFAATALACPGCKEGLSSPENPAASAKLTKGWARSITLLMWTPYLLFGGAAFAIVRSARRKK